jgi:hypothetical protein
MKFQLGIVVIVMEGSVSMVLFATTEVKHACPWIVVWQSMTVMTVKCGQGYIEGEVGMHCRHCHGRGRYLHVWLHKVLQRSDSIVVWQSMTVKCKANTTCPLSAVSFNTISGQKHCRHCHWDFKPATARYEAIDFYHHRIVVWQSVTVRDSSDDEMWEGTWKLEWGVVVIVIASLDWIGIWVSGRTRATCYTLTDACLPQNCRMTVNDSSDHEMWARMHWPEPRIVVIVIASVGISAICYNNDILSEGLSSLSLRAKIV